MAVADGIGNAILNVPLPSTGIGVTMHMQAYTDTGITCGRSNLVTQTIQ